MAHNGPTREREREREREGGSGRREQRKGKKTPENKEFDVKKERAMGFAWVTNKFTTSAIVGGPLSSPVVSGAQLWSAAAAAAAAAAAVAAAAGGHVREDAVLSYLLASSSLEWFSPLTLD